MSQLKSFCSVNQEIAHLLPLWTQGAGSNISYKITDELLMIKASGFRLDQVSEDRGFVYLNYKQLRSKLHNLVHLGKSQQEEAYSLSLSEVVISNQEGFRPSMESGFHAFSDYKWVLHFHSLAGILMGDVSQKKSDDFSKWIQKNKLEDKIHFIPLTKPGWELSQFFLENSKPINIIINHGVVLQSNNLQTLKEWENIEKSFLKEFGYINLLNLTHELRHQIKWKSDFLKGPIKFYFPDMAIYFSKLEPYLKSYEKNIYELPKDAPIDLKEIWMATQILFLTCPTLVELPDWIIEEITQLPTEKLRQKFFTQ